MRKFVVVLGLFAPALGLAQWGGVPDRAGSYELTIAAVNQTSNSVGGKASESVAGVPNSSSLSLDSNWGFSFNFTYNFTAHVALGADFDYLEPRYSLVLVPDDPLGNTVNIKHRASQFNGRIKGTYLFSENALTPFVDVGLGWTHFDSNVVKGDPITGCWWHPWWGYICENFYDTFSSTEFTYGTGVGLRYETKNGGAIKASYNYWWLDSGGQSEAFSLDSLRLEYAWRF